MRNNRKNRLHKEVERSRQMVSRLPEVAGDNEELRRALMERQIDRLESLGAGDSQLASLRRNITERAALVNQLRAIED